MNEVKKDIAKVQMIFVLENKITPWYSERYLL